MSRGVTADVFTADEVARATGLPTPLVVETMAATGVTTIQGTPYIKGTDALWLARLLLAEHGRAASRRELFATDTVRPAVPAAPLPLWGSLGIHAALVALVVWVSADAIPMAAVEETPSSPAHLVFIVSPGPGGGGGGGGLRNPLPARPAARRAALEAAISVPAAPPEPVEPSPAPEPAPEPPPEPPAPVAPVVETSADAEDLSGVIDKPEESQVSQGPGTEGGAGTGLGSGAGEGNGSGIGEGSGGGTGGGPYRAGSGVEPPRLIREVKATYTDDARRRGITGAVLLEIVVRRDGSVGDVSILRGLGAGLDQRAVDAVRQWRFSPARRLGTPVDVIVEVAVEFTLR